jgi:hypothetical protein
MAGQYQGALPSTQADGSGVADAIGRALGFSAPPPAQTTQAVPFIPAAFQRSAAPMAQRRRAPLPCPPHGHRRAVHQSIAI